MQTIEFHYRDITIPISFSRKKMRNIRLSVGTGGKVRLSAPRGESERRIREFLDKNAEWLYRKYVEKRERLSYCDGTFLSESGETMLLGQRKRVLFSPEGKGATEESGCVVIRGVSDNPAKREKATEDFFRAVAQKVGAALVDKWMPVFSARGASRPTLSFRKMRSRWGSCNAAKCAVNLNLHLFKADLACVEYVVVHELTHLLYKGHGAPFWAFVSALLPDWKERKRRLNAGLSSAES